MTRSPLHPLALTAAIAAALGLTACGAVPSAPKTTGLTAKRTTVVKASPKPSATPSAKPGASAAPSAAPTAKPTATPAPEDDEPLPAPKPVDPNTKVVVQGMVFGADGAAVGGAVVKARSLDATAPYEAEVATQGGSYVLNGVPSGANLEIVASKPGWTSRRRVGSFDGASGDRNAFDFGAPADAQTPAAPYYLSDAPEIVATTPAARQADVAPGKLRVTLELSEPLDLVGRARLARALRILPANDAANGGMEGSTTDLSTSEDAGYPRAVAVDGQAAVAPYALAVGSTFMADPTKAATLAWSADGKAATLVFDAPLLASEDEATAYQIALVSAGRDQRIRDEDGNQLGTDEAGGHGAYPEAGRLVPGAFKARRLRFRDVPGLEPGSAAARWAGTHDDAVRFSLAKDEATPGLMGVRTVYMGGDTRIELTFDEPMGAFNGTLGAFISPTLGDDAPDLANFTFAVGRTGAHLDEVELDGSPASQVPDVDPRLQASFGADDAQQEREFRFAQAAFAPQGAGAMAGSVVVELDDRDPRKVWVVIVGRDRYFAPEVSAIKARAGGVADPAGNVVGDRRADQATATGAL